MLTFLLYLLKKILFEKYVAPHWPHSLHGLEVTAILKLMNIPPNYILYYYHTYVSINNMYYSLKTWMVPFATFSHPHLRSEYVFPIDS